ncbi:MAG: pantetheine-phosphate adenylyltransferase [Oscillospiraceae bacterium]|nr:pantetheine-phosphate adenylyltransferase [Oscillospiraceae bacterium]MDD7470940.1 pantetheine-phosphate adenylyltransferase [Oscillospiraceae bacterium]MDO4397920.1 pantetheine-phosphate adenylyltransferase [Oscillospiraceae bacterium]MDY2677498.1 pantetheine-phosphate adenylyltransferase [Oscillospiraceae bacterium]
MAKTVICPGSFDPLTIGHLDIIKRTSKLFDNVIVVVMRNYNKDSGSFTVEERVDFIKRCTEDLPNVTVDSYKGLLADYARKKGACAVVKGLRAISDYDDEFRQALTNQKLNPELETVFMVTSSEYMFLSSSVVKQVCALGGDVSNFVPARIRDDIIARLGKKPDND